MYRDHVIYWAIPGVANRETLRWFHWGREGSNYQLLQRESYSKKDLLRGVVASGWAMNVATPWWPLCFDHLLVLFFWQNPGGNPGGNQSGKLAQGASMDSQPLEAQKSVEGIDMEWKTADNPP